jgi:succinate dehydrogenase/fumarate reductase-like Fe-S protein
MSKIATLLIRRDLPGEQLRWARFEVSFEPGQSVLDGLRQIRATQDQSLAFRYSCINANACKECVMSLDGKTVYACTARLEAREMRLEPLGNKELIHDLVTEIAPPDERLANLRKKPSVPPTD